MLPCAPVPQTSLPRAATHKPRVREIPRAFSSSCLACALSLCQRSARSRPKRKSLAEDISRAVEELSNTAEDAVLHLTRLPAWLNPETAERSGRRVVVLGTGWAAHAIAKVVDAQKLDVCVVSPRNYFVFTPMLAAASVGTVEYRSILEHIRSANPTIGYYQGHCTLDVPDNGSPVRAYPFIHHDPHSVSNIMRGLADDETPT